MHAELQNPPEGDHREVADRQKREDRLETRLFDGEASQVPGVGVGFVKGDIQVRRETFVVVV